MFTLPAHSARLRAGRSFRRRPDHRRVMKKLLPIAILLLFLLGGGSAAWWFMLRGEAPETAEVAAPPREPTFVSIDTMAVPVIRADGTIQTFLVELTLEVPRGEAAGLGRAAGWERRGPYG